MLCRGGGGWVLVVADCLASSTCSGNGNCAADGSCSCFTGFTGASCSACAAGYFGATCAVCPGGAGNVCNLRGTCSDGLPGSGLCTCNPGFAGTPRCPALHSALLVALRAAIIK